MRAPRPILAVLLAPAFTARASDKALLIELERRVPGLSSARRDHRARNRRRDHVQVQGVRPLMEQLAPLLRVGQRCGTWR